MTRHLLGSSDNDSLRAIAHALVALALLQRGGPEQCDSQHSRVARLNIVEACSVLGVNVEGL